MKGTYTGVWSGHMGKWACRYAVGNKNAFFLTADVKLLVSSFFELGSKKVSDPNTVLHRRRHDLASDVTTAKDIDMAINDSTSLARV